MLLFRWEMAVAGVQPRLDIAAASRSYAARKRAEQQQQQGEGIQPVAMPSSQPRQSVAAVARAAMAQQRAEKRQEGRDARVSRAASRRSSSAPPPGGTMIQGGAEREPRSLAARRRMERGPSLRSKSWSPSPERVRQQRVKEPRIRTGSISDTR